MAESRLRLTDEDRARLVEALEALIPEEYAGRSTGWSTYGDDQLRKWGPYNALLKRLKRPTPGGNDYGHLAARDADKRAAEKAAREGVE